VRVLHPFVGQDGSEAGVRVGVDRDSKAYAPQPRADRSVELVVHIGLITGVQCGAGDRHHVAEAATIEAALRPCYHRVARTHVLMRRQILRS
jgi:hypothetical protein